VEFKVGQNHHLRKELFARGLRQGYLTVDEIEHALPPGAMTPAERWLLYFSLRAAQIDIHGDQPPETLAEPGDEERERMQTEEPTLRS